MQYISLKHFIAPAFIIALSFFMQPQVCAKNVQHAPDKVLVNKLLQLTYNCQFKEAKEIVDQALKEDSLSLEWNFFDGMIVYYLMFVKRDYREEGSKFSGMMERVVKIGEDRLARNARDTTALFYTGGAYGYLARYIAKDGSFFKSAAVAKKGMDVYERLIATTPNCYDAYLSLGVYHSIASGIPWYIKPILYIFGKSGDEDKAVEYLTMVSLKGNLGVYEARWVLAQQYSRTKENEKAFTLYQSLASQFPNNPAYVSQVIKLLFDQKRYPEAIEIGKILWENNKSSTSYDGSLAESYDYLAQAYAETGKFREAIELFEKIIDMSTMVTYSYTMMGNIYEKVKDYEKAIDSYQKAVESGGYAKYRKMSEERLEVLTRNRK